MSNLKTTVTADQLGIASATDLPPASPARMAREAAQLNGLISQHNFAHGVTAPAPEPVAPVVSRILSPQMSKPEPVTHMRSPFNPLRLFYTGRTHVGKDHVAAATGATIFSFSEPLVAMLRLFFDTTDKNKHGARSLLQWMGQVGRGVTNERYPINASRAAFTVMVRSMGSRGEFSFSDVDWAAFGRNENIWCDALLKRVANFQAQPGNENRRVAVTGVRFPNEHSSLVAAGWTAWHVMVSTQTLGDRLRAVGLDPASPAMTTDESEQMAISLDRQAAQAAQRNPNAMLRCIWNDDKTSSPAPKAFHSLTSFLADLEIFS